MVSLLLVLAVCAAPGGTADNAARDHVDVIEINHYIDERGDPLVGQVLFFAWSDRDNRYNLRAWRFLSSVGDKLPMPTPDGGCVLRFSDKGVPREVYAKIWRQTWTRYDREVREQTHVAREQRPELARPVTR